ncbi:MAG: lipoyl synthase, partial [Phycisphaerales bacterium]
GFQRILSPAMRRARKLPPWLRRPLSVDKTFAHTEQVLGSLGLETICTNTNCPNRGECWSRGTATVLILGNICTRNCKFCSVAAGKPAPPDPAEPLRVARMTEQMGLKYLVITSVDRDDLADGGAAHFRDCIRQVRRRCPDVEFEILTPDFRGRQAAALAILKDAMPFVFGHNVETVPSLYPAARAGGDYQCSLNLLRMASETFAGVRTKSSIMLGLGETKQEVEHVLRDLRGVGCARITIGQYLKPSRESLEVAEYIRPDEFDRWRERARELGFSWVMSSPFARSSYFAEKADAS